MEDENMLHCGHHKYGGFVGGTQILLRYEPYSFIPQKETDPTCSPCHVRNIKIKVMVHVMCSRPHRIVTTVLVVVPLPFHTDT